MKGTVSPLQTTVDTEQFRKLQESERYIIHVSGTKNKNNTYILIYSSRSYDTVHIYNSTVPFLLKYQKSELILDKCGFKKYFSFLAVFSSNFCGAHSPFFIKLFKGQ